MVANTVSGLESRILSIATHAFFEGVVNYGLTVYGTHWTRLQEARIDSGILKKVARKLFGTGITDRREIMNALADTKSYGRHYLLKSAHMVDRVLRASGNGAQVHIVKFIKLAGFFPRIEGLKHQVGSWVSCSTNVTLRDIMDIHVGSVNSCSEMEMRWILRFFPRPGHEL